MMHWAPSLDYVDVFWQSIQQPKHRMQTYFSYLSEHEQARASAIHCEYKRQQFILTRGRLRELLAGGLHCSPKHIKLITHVSGKPLTRMQWCSKPIYFNLSHSAALSVIALSIRQPLGVDVQQLTTRQNILPLAKRYFSVAEFQQLSVMDSASQHYYFYKYWVYKEALAKASQQSVWQILPVEILPIVQKSSRQFFFNHSVWYFQSLLVNAYYMAALAMGLPAVTIRQHGLFATQEGA